MEGMTDFTQRLAAVLPPLSDREMLDCLLSDHDCKEPDLKSIAYAYQKLIHNLHRQIQELKASDTRFLPRVCAFPTGSLMMGKSSTGPFKIVVFGSISADNYHDLLWEAIQKVPQYAISNSGVTEMQKLPVLRFLIKFDGYTFDLQYHQSVSLISKYYSETCTTAILNAPVSSLKQICTQQVLNALLEAKKCAQQWKKFQDEPHLRYTYYIYRAWAILNGVFDDAMDAKIIDSLLHDYEQPDHPIFHELSSVAPRNQIELLSDKDWVALLQYWEELPLSARMESSNYAVISVISDVPSSKWLRHIEKRLLNLESRLAEFDLIASMPSELPKHGNRFPSPRKEYDEPATTDLDPLFDPATWETLSFNLLELPMKGRELHRQWALDRLEHYGSPNPDLELPNLELRSNTIAFKDLTFKSGDKEDQLEQLSLEDESIDGVTDLPEFNVDQIRSKMLQQKKDQIIRWPTRQVLFQGSNSGDSAYEGYYILGFKLHSLGDWEKISSVVERWTDEISMHETTLHGKCFITPTMMGSIQFKQWEEDNGNLSACTRTLSDLFLTPPNPIVGEENPSSPKMPKSHTLKHSKQAKPQSPEPTPSLRRASDILNRLRHDSKFNIDEYYIGYKDRFVEELMEMPARNWVKETTDEEFVPEGRIWYFKRKGDEEEGEIMWDREKKIDRICGSGVSGGDEHADEEGNLLNGRMRL